MNANFSSDSDWLNNKRDNFHAAPLKSLKFNLKKLLAKIVINISESGSSNYVTNVYVTISKKQEDVSYIPNNRDNLCGSYEGILPSDNTLVTCRLPITGQFVQLQLSTNYYLWSIDVEVHGS